MNTEKIKTIEDQTAELIENITLIKSELLKKGSARAQFEQESNSIVKALTNVVTEIENVRSLFESLGESEMIELFTKINQTNQQLKTVSLELQEQLDSGFSAFSALHKRLEVTHNDLNKEYSRHLSAINSLTTAIENYHQYTDIQIKLVSQEVQGKLKQSEKRFNEYEENMNKRMDRVMEQLSTFEAQQQSLSNKTDQILKWLETNGAILLANSRAGIFGRKI